MRSATQTTGDPIGYNEALGRMSVFIKEAYYHYYDCLFPYVADLAMTADNWLLQ